MSDEKATEAKKPTKTNQEILMEICKSYKYFKDENGKPYAEVVDPHGKMATIEVESSDFMNNAKHDFFKTTGKMPVASDLKNISELIGYQVKTSNSIETMHFRFGHCNGNNYIDLNNDANEVVEIEKMRWSIIQNSSIKFRKTAQQKILCTPKKYHEADFKAILKYLRLSDKNQEMLVLATICSFVRTDIIRPILCFVGQSNSGKTTNARVIRSLIDPREPIQNNTLKNAQNLAIVLHQNALPFFDNQPKIHQEMSDMLCTAVTGAGFESRTLYTNTDQTHLSYKRGILMTALELPSTMPDFMDRCVHIELDRLPPKKRGSDKSFWEDFERDKPKIFGGLLDTVQKAKMWEDRFTFTVQPRLVDFARFGAAVCDVLGYDANNFMNALMINVEHEKQKMALETDPYVNAIFELIKNKNEYEGTMSSLLIELSKYLGKHDKSISPEKFGKRFNQLIGYLKNNNIEVDSKRTNNGRLVRISRIDPISTKSENESDIYVTRNIGTDSNLSEFDMEESNIFG